MLEKKSGNFADLDYSGIHTFDDPDLDFNVYQYQGEWFYIWLEHGNGPIGPFATSADAYHDAQGY